MKLALGTAQFGLDYGVSNVKGRVSYAEVKKILSAAIGHIDLLDTARVYGDSEKVLGEYDETACFDIVSKICLTENSQILDDVRDSLQTLNKPSMKGLLVHNPEVLLESGGGKAYAELQFLKEEGLVERIGVSVYDPEVLSNLTKHYDFGIVQFPANILDQRFEGCAAIQRLSDMGVILCARSIFLQGALLMDIDLAIEKFPKQAEFLTEYFSCVERCGLTKLQAAISAINRSGLIDYALVGVTSALELNEIIQCSKSFSTKIYEGLFDIVANVPDELIDPRRW